MDLGSITHRGAFSDAYALNESDIMLKLRTGKDITEAYVIHGDPYSAGVSPNHPWSGTRTAMKRGAELKYNQVWEIRLKPPFRREQYYFELHCGTEVRYMFEDDFYTEEEMTFPYRMHQYFKFPWMNEADRCRHPKWVEDTVWYQIMPDRFCRGDAREKRHPLKKWNEKQKASYFDFYGGDLKGIIEKLHYLKDLGISGIYLTPVMLSNSNHKYNTADYLQIDPDFGDEEDMRCLVERAHALGIRVMVDAVFNHCGWDFFAWQDVLKNGLDSPYCSWFFIHKWPVDTGDYKTKDGRYDSFAFEAGMPKLNTNNLEVQDYFLQIMRHWVKDWQVDGIRFDVGNEVSHAFLKRTHTELKGINPDLFLLGEIWHDSIEWLLGDEYDAVMNYPFLESLHNFWLNGNLDARQLMYAINRCYNLYREQTNRVLFNFLDTHDVCRAFTRCGNLDTFFQQMILLLSMQGSPCLYYGTEIAMEGADDPENRRCMPWEEIDAGKYDDVLAETKVLIALRNQYDQMKSGTVSWEKTEAYPRLVSYCKGDERTENQIAIYLNAGQGKVPLQPEGKVLYARKYENGNLLAGGSLLVLRAK